MSYYRLAVLHSTKIVNQRLAQQYFHAYLKVEPDPAKRQSAMAEMKKYWVMQ